MSSRSPRTDRVGCAVVDYLKGRAYIGSHEKDCQEKDLKLSQTVQEMALRRAVSCELGVAQPIKMGPSYSRDLGRIEDEYLKFRNFVAEAVEPLKSELTHCLWPVFVNGYIDLLNNDQKAALQRFDVMFSGLFAGAELYKNVVDTISSVTNVQELNSCPVLKDFREHKALVKLSLETWNYLEKFLQCNPCIRHLFNVHIDVNIQLGSVSSHPSPSGKGGQEPQSGHLAQARHISDSLAVSSLATYSRKLYLNGTHKVPKKGHKHEQNGGSANGIENSTNKSRYAANNSHNEVSSGTASNANGEDTTSSESMYLLRQSVDKCRSSLPPPPNLLLFTVDSSNMQSSVISIADSEPEQGSFLALGMDNSTVALQRLESQQTVDHSEPDKRTEKASMVSLHSSAYIDNQLERPTETEISLSSNSHRLIGHSGPVYSVAFVPRSRLLLSASEDSTVKAWNIDSMENVAVFKGHQYPLWDVSVSKEGMYFATGSHDTSLRLWSLSRSFPLRIYSGHTADVDRVEFHPNCNYIASASSDCSMRLWSVQSGNMVRLFPAAHKGQVHSLCFSPNGQWLASGGEDRCIKIWDLKNCQILADLRGHDDTVTGVVFSKCGNLLISCSYDDTIRIWDISKSTGCEPSEANSATSGELLCSIGCHHSGTLQASQSQLRHLSTHDGFNLITAIRLLPCSL